MAIFSFVPTPSALETRIGYLNFLVSSAKSAPKLPMPPRTPLVKVRVARWRMRCLASSATAMLTPASAYFMTCDSFLWDENFDTEGFGRARGTAGLEAAQKIWNKRLQRIVLGWRMPFK